MGIPYTNLVEAVCVAGTANCIRLPVPYRGVLKRLIIKQADGVLAGYDYNLYDRRDACGQTQQGTSTTTTTTQDPNIPPPFMDAELHKLMATTTVGATASSERFALDVPYENQDDQEEYGFRRETAIYLEIIPVGTGNKTFQVAYTAESDSL